ncbi:MAG: hypothetical protein WD872_16955 [Pirellulaceae bacterium]
MSSIMFLIMLVTVGNFALGFGLAVHLGFGPDWQRVASQWRDLRFRRSRATEKPAEH